MALLDETGVALVHGTAFGLAGALAAELCGERTRELEDAVSAHPGVLRGNPLGPDSPLPRRRSGIVFAARLGHSAIGLMTSSLRAIWSPSSA